MTLYKAMSAVKRRELEDEVEQLRKAEKAADAEIRRLRAENAELTAFKEKWRAGTVDSLCEKLGKLEAENAELNAAIKSQRDIWITSDCTLRAELEWFRRREEPLQVVLSEPEFPSAWGNYTKWLMLNPKPGAGT